MDKDAVELDSDKGISLDGHLDLKDLEISTPRIKPIEQTSKWSITRAKVMNIFLNSS